MITSFCLLDKRRPLLDGTFPLKIAAGSGTNLYISTGISVQLWEWDEQKARIVDRKDAKHLNNVLEIKLLRTRARMLQLQDEGLLKTASASYLRKLLTAPDMGEVPREDIRADFFDVADRFMRAKDNRESTRQLYRYTLDKVRAYVGDGPLHIEDMRPSWLYGLQQSLGGRINARAVHLRNIRTICNFALYEELTAFYPFRKFKIRTEETRKKALTLGQLRAYATADIHYRNDAMHRDVFMLLFYLRGMNISDLAGITWKDIRDGRLEYRRHKTGTLYSVKLEPEALAIIERWKGKEHLLSVFDRYKVPSHYDRRLCGALKRIKAPDGEPIEPECSSNWARHTWATLCAELDVPEATISLGMGHKRAGHRVTDIYIKRNRDKVDEANRKVIDYIFGPLRESLPRIAAKEAPCFM